MLNDVLRKRERDLSYFSIRNELSELELNGRNTFSDELRYQTASTKYIFWQTIDANIGLQPL